MAKKRITLTIEDADGDKSSVSVYIESIAEHDESESSILTTFAVPFWDAIKPLITGVLVNAQAVLEYDLSEFDNNTPTMTSDVEEKAVFLFAPYGSYRPLRLSLPTIKESVFTNSGAAKEIDFTNSDVAFFATVMTQSIDEFGINAVDSHNNQLHFMIEGEQSFGKG